MAPDNITIDPSTLTFRVVKIQGQTHLLIFQSDREAENFMSSMRGIAHVWEEAE